MRLWRLLWWNEILQYTLWGDYFWQGKDTESTLQMMTDSK